MQGFYTASFGKGIGKQNDKQVFLEQDYLADEMMTMIQGLDADSTYEFLAL